MYCIFIHYCFQMCIIAGVWVENQSRNPPMILDKSQVVCQEKISEIPQSISCLNIKFQKQRQYSVLMHKSQDRLCNMCPLDFLWLRFFLNIKIPKHYFYVENDQKSLKFRYKSQFSEVSVFWPWILHLWSKEKFQKVSDFLHWTLYEIPQSKRI